MCETISSDRVAQLSADEKSQANGRVPLFGSSHIQPTCREHLHLHWEVAEFGTLR